jgi:hypothetical protein
MSRLLAAPRALSLARRAPPAAARRTVFTPAAAPPRLAPAEQAEFERLQRASRGAFSSSNSDSNSNGQSPPSEPPPAHEQQQQQQQVTRSSGSVADAAELHPDVRRGAEPEFDGDVNPATGEVGGPKNEPLRWGEGGDWSYNGRVTDF